MNVLKKCLVLVFAAMVAWAAETADELFASYRQEIVRLQHFGSNNGNPPDGYRELLPIIDKVVEQAPDNPEYRLSALYHHVTIALYDDVPWAQKISLYRQFIAEAAKFNADFPTWPKRVVKAGRPAAQTTLLLNAFAVGRNLDGSLNDRLPPADENELKEVLAVLHELQRLCHEETVRKSGIELSDKPFASQREMQLFCGELTEEFSFVNDNAASFLTCKELEKAILRRLVHSGDLECGHLTGHGFPFLSFPAVVEKCGRLFADDLQGLREALSDQEYLELLAKVTSVEVQLKLLSLKALKRIVEAPEPQRTIVQEVVALYQQAEEVIGKPLRKDEAAHHFRNFLDTCKWLCGNGFLPPNLDSPYQIEAVFFNEYQKSVTAPVSDLDFLCNLPGRINSPDLTWDIFLSELEAHAEGLAKHSVYELLKGNPTDVSYQIVSKCLYETDVEAARRIRAILCPMQERLMKHPEFAELLDFYGDFAEREEILSLDREEWREYVCCASPTAVYVSCWTLFYKFDIETGKMTPLPRIPLEPFDFRWPKLSIEGSFCLAHTKDKVALFDLQTEKWTVAQKCFGGEIVSAAVVGDKLYLLAYEKLEAEKNSICLYRCNLDGTDGKTLFSTRERGAIDGLPDDPTLKVSELVKATPDTLLCMLASRTGYGGVLLEYDIPHDRLKTLHRLRANPVSVHLGKLPDGRVVGTSPNGLFLLEDGRLVNFVNRSQGFVDPAARHNLQTNNVAWPVLVMNDYLISPERKQIVNLRNPEESPVAWLPTSKEAMPFSEGRFCLMNNLGVWLFRLPENVAEAVDTTSELVRQKAVPIPRNLLVFRKIYDLRRSVLVVLALAWLIYAVRLLVRRRRSFFAWLLVLPLVILPLCIGMTWCGWHYRMELRREFAGYSAEAGAYSLDRMPPNIRVEYARNDYHPRFRDIKAQMLGTVVFMPILYLIGFLLFAAMKKAHGPQGGHASKPPEA